MNQWSSSTLKCFKKKKKTFFSFLFFQECALWHFSLYVTNIWKWRTFFLNSWMHDLCHFFVCEPFSFAMNYSCTYLNFNYQLNIVKNHTAPKNISTITLKLRMHYSFTWLLPCWGRVATFSCETTKKFCVLLPSSEVHVSFHHSC